MLRKLPESYSSIETYCSPVIRAVYAFLIDFDVN